MITWDRLVRAYFASMCVAGVLLLLLSPSVPAAADKAHRIVFDPGGVMFKFIDRYKRFIDNGTRVIIDGPCLSACALVLMLPRDQVCTTERAVLGFHSITQTDQHGHPIGYDREWTRVYWRLLPRMVRARITAVSGWDGESEHPDLVYLEDEMLEGVLERCWR